MIIWYRNHASTTIASETRAARRSPTMQSSASTGGRHFLTISLDTAGLRRRVWRAGIFKDNCQLVVCYCVSSDHAYRNSMELFIPIVHAVRHNPAVSRNIWQNGSLIIWARIPQSRSSSCGSNSTYRLSLHKHDFISNQLLFYGWFTQQHFNFSVSFSFNVPKNLSVRCVCHGVVYWRRCVSGVYITVLVYWRRGVSVVYVTV